MKNLPFLLGLLALALAGCSEPEATTKPQETDPNLLEFRVKGVVQKVKAEGEVIVIDHEEIPDYMEAMIMPFFVKDTAEVADLKPGDQVEFDYFVDKETRASWIENVDTIGNAGEVKSEEPPTPTPTSLIEIGEPFPDYAFLDENGNPVRLSDFRGGPVAFTFVFTRCPVPEYCPAMMLKFAEVQQQLAGDKSPPESWRLLTISFDADHDTPEVMKAYGQVYDYDPEHWSLLTSETWDTIAEIAGNVGLKYGDNKGSYQHNLRTAVLDANGKLRALYTDETWEVSDLVESIKTASQASS